MISKIILLNKRDTKVYNQISLIRLALGEAAISILEYIKNL